MPDSIEPDDVAVGGRTPRTYLGWSVAATVLCFLPLGLIAVVYSLRASSALADGRHAAAARAGRVARRWLVSAVIVGVVVDLVIVASLLLLGAYST
jgi:hypothetical protein